MTDDQANALLVGVTIAAGAALAIALIFALVLHYPLTGV
jgi:hypothetical protein